MKRKISSLFVIVSAILLSSCISRKIDNPLSVTLHDSHGLTAASAHEQRLELILFSNQTHLHLRIANTSDQTLTLWRPLCPEGDSALVIEFRDPASPDKVFRAMPEWDYTGGMGVPKVFELVARDELIVNVDFVSDGEWAFPVAVPNDARLELEVRVGYRSQNLIGEKAKLFRDYSISGVWEGEVVGKWQRLTVVNRSGKAVGKIMP